MRRNIGDGGALACGLGRRFCIAEDRACEDSAQKWETPTADFTVMRFQLNTGSSGTVDGSTVWTAVPAWGAGTGQELRYSDSSAQGAVASASWPAMIRPAATGLVNYLYVFTADAVSLGYIGSTSNTPIAFSNANYRDLRLDYDNLGTFGNAPIVTAYTSNAHATPSRGDNSIIGGNTTDTGATARSYLKGNMFGRVDSAGKPAAAPTNAPVVTDGATGALSPTAGANWCTNYQGLQGDTDYLQFPSTPAATTADQISLMLALFTGPNMANGTYTNSLACKYTFV